MIDDSLLYMLEDLTFIFGIEDVLLSFCFFFGFFLYYELNNLKEFWLWMWAVWLEYKNLRDNKNEYSCVK